MEQDIPYALIIIYIAGLISIVLLYLDIKHIKDNRKTDKYTDRDNIKVDNSRDLGE